MYKLTSRYNTIGVSALMMMAGTGPVSISCHVRSCEWTLASHARPFDLVPLADQPLEIRQSLHSRTPPDEYLLVSTEPTNDMLQCMNTIWTSIHQVRMLDQPVVDPMDHWSSADVQWSSNNAHVVPLPRVQSRSIESRLCCRVQARCYMLMWKILACALTTLIKKSILVSALCCSIYSS